ncbi:calcineurin-binding protein cabin-1-like [Hyposmocoma kahamanoa]|uniref:calcineurin-binding protein cabin-1-like n=1 Tax=Hyposmocoma kahamanoa TaxID=1477025 RepID=UPI000E6D627D|nr:calcineurin-binding protein cabin-1-like [Hyposmocoma kahamanoa]
MIKISALNKESEEESRSEEEVTREALEQIALQQYAKALELQRKGNLSDATQLVKDLLDTEVIYEVKKPAPGEKITGPLFNLKYLCYKNLASMLSNAGEVEAAIDAYCAATELDDTDVTLWHRLGLLCLRAERYEMALQVFQRGTEQNPKHWPCLDKIVTLLFALDYKEECISTIYETLHLDPGYMRGIVYRKHIYSTYPHLREFMEYLNPFYKWNETDDDVIDEEKAEKLLKEAQNIKDIFLSQQNAQKFGCVLPVLKLNKPITNLTWEAVGESLIHMHHYIEINAYSHACPIEIIYEKQEHVVEVNETIKETEQKDSSPEENQIDIDKMTESVTDNENNDASDKTVTDEKNETDREAPVQGMASESVTEPTAENTPEPKKRSVARRRGSALSFLEQWEWCTKRRSGRKKTANRQDDDNIYETLRRMVPAHLAPDAVQKEDKNVNATVTEFSLEVEEKSKNFKDEQYFGTDNEQQDIKQFITKFTESKKDIIDMLRDYLWLLCQKTGKWPESLPKVFTKANECYKSHIDIPACVDDNHDDLIHYTLVNLLVEEFSVSEKLLVMTTEDKQKHDISVIESIGVIITLKPYIFTNPNILELTIRHHWVKLHIHILNKCDEIALDYLYQLSYEFEAMGEHQETFNLVNDNFAFKPVINQSEISAYIKFLERNKKLSKVMELYERGCYEEVLLIVIDSFEHCKNLAKNQEEEMSLDFAVQLSLILDTLWALDRVDSCLKWSLICLHEALKHYFRLTSASSDYDKWTMAVVKILSCMEHILTNEGLTCLDSASSKELSQGLEDLIRIIGHQVETNAAEMPFGTVVPWIILHYILQREEDQGRGRAAIDKDKLFEEVPNSLMVLFIAHENLGNREWCCKSDGKLLYFILDTVVPRLRSPYLSKCLEQVCQYMEQCVYCLYGHPGRKNKVKYLADHNVTPFNFDWKRAQQLYEIFRPPTLPVLEGKVSGISGDTEQLFRNILTLLPMECDPQKYIPEVEKYIKGIEDKLPTTPPLLPYKMKDIYFLLGDYYFKKDDVKMAIKYNILDVVVNKDRLESWAEISLAKGVNLERILNSCKNLNNEREILNPAKAIIRCYKRSLEIDPTHCNLWIEYGIFAYTIHSFCSRVLKQASESLSMEDFESLEKQKEELLDTTYKCFMAALDLNSNDSEKANEDLWLFYYMLGKIAEKRNKPPSEYLNYYMQGVKSLQEAEAIYPLKINYNSPAHSCIEVLELHYRIHASILKYIEQHENKTITLSVGKVFSSCIEEWKNGPFSKKFKKEIGANSEAQLEKDAKTIREPIHAANILKRSISDVGEEDTQEGKKLKLEAAAAKVKRSASYDTERVNTETSTEDEAQNTEPSNKVPEHKKVGILSEPMKLDTVPEPKEVDTSPALNKTDTITQPNKADAVPKINESGSITEPNKTDTVTEPNRSADIVPEPNTADIVPEIKKVEFSTDTFYEKKYYTETKIDQDISVTEKQLPAECDDIDTDKKENGSSSSSSSSSDSSSSDSSSDSSSESSRDSDASSKSCNDKTLPEEEITQIVIACIEALEDCACRLSPHYKAIYRLAHYHFYNKKGKDIERCRDLMLSTCMSRTGQKLGGLFSERKTSNFFNNVWKIPKPEVDRAGGFAFHMSRSAQLTMEILKEIDDHKTLLDLSLYLQRIPEPDKKYLRDSDREELAQQAFTLCVQSLKGQLQKFSQQSDLKSNEVERQALKSLMLDIYRAYTRYHKQLSPNIKSTHFTNLLVDAYKLITTIPIADNLDLVDLSTKYCHSLQQTLRQQAAQASLDKSHQQQKKQTAKIASTASFADPTKLITAHSTTTVPKTNSTDLKTTMASISTGSTLPKMSAHEMTAAFQSFLPVLNDPISQQTAAALSYLNNISALASYSSLQSTLQSTLQNSLQNSFQAEFYRQFLNQSLSSSYLPPPRKQKRGPKTANTSRPGTSNTSQAKSFSSASTTFTSKTTSNTGVSILQKSNSASLAPTMGKVLPSLPASMTANLSSFGASTSNAQINTCMPSQAHMSGSMTTVNAAIHTKPPLPHEQVSPGKTLQEKLAERQKNLPNMSKGNNFVVNRLPASLTIKKTVVPKPAANSDEVIVLDDD